MASVLHQTLDYNDKYHDSFFSLKAFKRLKISLLFIDTYSPIRVEKNEQDCLL